MSRAGYFEPLLRQVEEESFAKKALQEIAQLKDRLTKKLQKLEVQGDFRKATEVQFQLDKLEKDMKIIKRLVEG